jgi:hypothetical protein
MKTQIITLEAHDDLVSVRDRMSWAKSPRILLVWPGFEKVALGPLDLRILQQHGRNLGAQIGLVTRRGEVRRDAKAFGIPVFRSTVEAQREAWLAPSRRKPRRGDTPAARLPALRLMREQIRRHEPGWTSYPLPRMVFFGLGVLAVLSLVALFVPRATIKLRPTSREQSVLMPVEIAESAGSGIPLGGLPAQVLRASVSGTQSTRITSRAAIPQEYSRGTARFQNLSQSPVIVPSGTVVLSISPRAVRFTTVDEARLDGKVQAFVDVPIEALEPGEIGNVAANTLQALEGRLGASVSVTNPEPTTGGTETMEVVASDADRNRLRLLLLITLREDAETDLIGSIGEADLLLPNSMVLVGVQEEVFDPAQGKPGSLLSLKMRADFAAKWVKAEDLKRLAEATLNASVPAGFHGAAETLQFELATPPTQDFAETWHLVLRVRRSILRDVDAFRASQLVRGLPSAEAVHVLQAQLPLAEAPEIRLIPSWWPVLPLIPFRITMSVP